jgi:hypothetical protein
MHFSPVEVNKYFGVRMLLKNSFLVHYSALKMAATYSAEMMVDCHRIKLRSILKYVTLQFCRILFVVLNEELLERKVAAPV